MGRSYTVGGKASRTLFCPAKINLFLEITGKREDGYHTIESVMQKIALCDRLQVDLSEGAGITFSSNDRTLPRGEKNLAVRAAAAYLAAAGLSRRVEIFLYKKIPVAAGMGGGSADAAGVLSAMDSLIGALGREALASLALSLGADVPFCLFHSAALCRGVGEEFTPCRGLPDCHIAVARHRREAVSTRGAYALIDRLSYRPASSDALRRALARGSLDGVSEGINRFEEAILPLCPRAAEAKAVFRSQGALLSLMSGSGPSVFGLFREKERAESACAALREKGYLVFLTRPWR